MAMKKLTMEEADRTPMPFDVGDIDAYLDTGWESLEALLRAHGWKGETKKIAANKELRTNSDIIDTVINDIAPKKK